MDIHPSWEILSKNYFCKIFLLTSLNNYLNSQTGKQALKGQLLATLPGKPETR